MALQALGFTATGIEAGSLVALCQSAAIGGTAASSVLVGAAVAVPVIASAAIGFAVVVKEYDDAQKNTLGASNALNDLANAATATPWVLIWENWFHGVQFRLFKTKTEAQECCKGGRNLRRMIVRLHPEGIDETNDHGQRNPWCEVEFHGVNVLVDNTLRTFLRWNLDTMTKAYLDAQKNTLGVSDALNDLANAATATPWVLIWENWHHGIHVRLFKTKGEAQECSKGGRKLRRMIVRLHPEGIDEANEHGQRNPWKEIEFHGENVLVDNDMRAFLSRMLSHTHLLNGYVPHTVNSEEK